MTGADYTATDFAPAALLGQGEIIVDLRHHRRAFADRRAHALGRIGAHVANGEHAGARWFPVASARAPRHRPQSRRR